jgi:hypothetical protein
MGYGGVHLEENAKWLTASVRQGGAAGQRTQVAGVRACVRVTNEGWRA